MKRMIKAATLQDMIDVFEDKIDELSGVQPIGTASYIDVDGLFGERGAEYTDQDMKEYWDEAHDDDPVLMGFPTFDAWYKATVADMQLVEGACTGEKFVKSAYEIDEAGKDEIINWLSDHDQAYEDAMRYFKVKDLRQVSGDELEGWISDHDQLLDDYCDYFGLNCEDIVGCGQGGII